MTPNVVFCCMTLEFQQISCTIYVTGSELIRHVPPLAPLREFLDDDDMGPERTVLYGGREKRAVDVLKFGYTFSSICPTM